MMLSASLLILLTAIVGDDETPSSSPQKSTISLPAIWTAGKITPEQPFPAEVIAVGGNSPWSAGVDVYLKETGKSGRTCKAFITENRITYTIIPPLNQKEFIKDRAYAPCVFTPPVKIENFSWTHMGMFNIGKHFGDKDLVKKHYRWKKQFAAEAKPQKAKP